MGFSMVKLDKDAESVLVEVVQGRCADLLEHLEAQRLCDASSEAKERVRHALTDELIGTTLMVVAFDDFVAYRS